MDRKLRWIAAAALAGIVGFGVAADAGEGDAAAETPSQVCLTPAAWTVPDGERSHVTSATALLTEMAKRQVVLLGEGHDEDDHHRWQLQALAVLHAQRPDMVIGFEMFPRRVQPVLDSWVAGDLTVRQFLEQSEWRKVWDLPADLYLPLFQFARINRIPMVALNVDEKLNKAVAAKGWDAIPESEREGVGRPAPPSKAYRDYLFEIYREHGTVGGNDTTKAEATDRAFGYFVEAQTTWDRAMAEPLARYALAGSGGGKPLTVGIMGSSHIRFGHGVPHQLRVLGVKHIGTLLPLPFDADCSKDLRAGLADGVFALPQVATARPEPPRLGVRLEESEGGVRIVDVTAGSLADGTGLKAGDLLVEVAGIEVKTRTPVIAAIRQQPAGTWLPIRVKRGGETLDLVVKFPAKP
jgi:uncharacterized iron-regulated protein